MKKFKDLVQGDVIYKVLSDKSVYKLTLKRTPDVIAGEDLHIWADLGDIYISCTKLCSTFYREDGFLTFQQFTAIIGGTENSIKIGPKFCKSWRNISENTVLFLKDTINGSIKEVRPKEVFASDDYTLMNIQELEDIVIINRRDEGNKVVKWKDYYISYNLDNIASYIKGSIRFYENRIQSLEEETIKLQYLLDTYESI